MNIFINGAIHNGIINYMKFEETGEIDIIHIFEFWVIKTLTVIYDDINIINPYKLNDENSFRKNLLIYGLKETELNLFIQYMNEYDQWLNSTVLVPKTDLPNKIEAIIINMILMKSTYEKISPEELEHYNNFLDPESGDMVKIQNLIVTDKTSIPKFWRIKRAGLTGGLTLTEIEPELLTASDYKRYGLNINEVKQLSNLKIKEINDKILAEDAANAETSGGGTKFDPKKLILTSGSGFVDTIVLLSIMITEIMVGLIIAFSFLR